MSSIRLFILSSFAELGPLHGHRLRLEAEGRHVSLWTDFTVGAVYGAMKRLAGEGLLRETEREQVGARPTRQLFEITEAGREALARLRREELAQIRYRHDPFDLALTEAAGQGAPDLGAMLTTRLAALRALLAETRAVAEGAAPNVGRAKRWALRHADYRLEAEIAYLSDLLADLPEIEADERARRQADGGTA